VSDWVAGDSMQTAAAAAAVEQYAIVISIPPWQQAHAFDRLPSSTADLSCKMWLSHPPTHPPTHPSPHPGSTKAALQRCEEARRAAQGEVAALRGQLRQLEDSGDAALASLRAELEAAKAAAAAAGGAGGGGPGALTPGLGTPAAGAASTPGGWGVAGGSSWCVVLDEGCSQQRRASRGCCMCQQGRSTAYAGCKLPKASTRLAVMYACCACCHDL
jgi:hypothetical protein